MKKLYNILLIIISIAIVIVLALIIIKYGKNYENEKKLEEVVINLTSTGIETDKEETKKIEAEYKGHKIIGVITIPKINLEYPILENTTEETLKLSITKFWGNNVNEIGNLTLSGHNNHDGTMFGKTKKLKIGDIIELTDLQKNTKKYKIYSIFNTHPNDVSIIETEEFGTREVTLITCTNGNKERLIIKAREILE